MSVFLHSFVILLIEIGGITYIIYNGKRAYLSSIMDLYTRNIISYKISYHMDNTLVMDTLNEAIRKQKDVHGVILHSNQGFQYTSNEYKAICKSNGIIISMSPKRIARR